MPQAAHRAKESSGRRLDDEAAIDYRDEIENSAMPRVDEPVDVHVRPRFAEGCGNGQAMDDVAERPEPHQQDPALLESHSFVVGALPPRILAMRSRVEWSLGSPTI